jgi:hypothetical protein
MVFFVIVLFHGLIHLLGFMKDCFPGLCPHRPNSRLKVCEGTDPGYEWFFNQASSYVQHTYLPYFHHASRSVLVVLMQCKMCVFVTCTAGAAPVENLAYPKSEYVS